MTTGWFRHVLAGLFRRRKRDAATERIHARFKKTFGISFDDPSLLRTALTHRSYLDPDEDSTSNERLEFLGDSVLGLVASDYLYRSMDQADEGDLTKARSRVVSKNALGKIGLKLGILDLLLYARDEIRADERAFVTLSADALEAVVGAIYLDRGLRCAREFVIDRIVDPIGDASSEHGSMDYKSELQELCQARFKVHPEYRIVRRLGPEHRKVFHVEVRIKGETYGFGSGRSRKDAEQVAASQAILNLSNEDD